MGVPKFYRWISERYPLINQMISGAVILPEIDNFYLDMNGIIHACTHPNDNQTANALSLREMMLSIFRYVDRIVTEIVKPKKVLFLAIDGVAPRAKLNQQRARRFRAAQDRLESIEKAKQRGEVVDEENMFDSNCITPGTEFMDQVSKHLKWYIRKKIKEDPLWKNLNVIFSGHDVPGEGEHKIMQYIRDMRASPMYEPNTRHCMYGQDADLIMLGLACHEPHFCLLREVINFNSFKSRRSARETVMRQTEDAQFQLLHLSLLREYLALDFAYGIQHPVDQERIIDDFIFLTFLVGNDFLPHLPTLDISEHAFDVLINAYRQLYEETPGYIVANGEISDYARLEKLFGIIGSQEYDILANREIQNKEYQARMRKNETFAGNDDDNEEAEGAMQAAFEAALKEARGEEPDGTDDSGFVHVSSKKSIMSEEEKAVSLLVDDDDDAPGVKKDYRGRYYFEKFRILSETKEGNAFLRTLMSQYLKGLGWCLAYYVKGCISWTWYYPYHYGPMLQDMNHLDELRATITYDLGSPFTPYQQLLGCLPPASAILLPKCYQWLMTSTDSPVLDCYPMDFKIDQDGKKNPWEAVVLLDFIDENKLLAAESEYCPIARLTRHEIARNKFGFLHHYLFDLNATDTYLSCNPEIGLPDIHVCNSTCSESVFSLTPGFSFKAELMAGTEYPIAGFPSLTVLQLDSIVVEPIKLDVFGSFSRYKTLVINLTSNGLGEMDVRKAELILGRSVFVNYPQMHEAKVISLLSPIGEYRLENPGAAPSEAKKVSFIEYDEDKAKKWAEYVAAETNFYLKGRGKPGTGGLNIGETSLRLKVLPLQGMIRDPVTGSRKKVFSKASEADIPLQLALWQPTSSDNRFVEVDELPIEKLLPVGVEVVAISGGYTGFKGTVIGPHGAAGSAKKAPTTPRKRVVDVEFSIPKCLEPPFGYSIARAMTEDYYSSRDVCSMLDISPSVLGKIVGSVRLEPGRIDLGLNLKRNGMHQLLGYIRKIEQSDRNTSRGAKVVRKVWTGVDTVKVVGMINDEAGNGTVNGESVYWEYTSLAINLIAEYKARFPLVFYQLQKLPHEAVYKPTTFFGEKYEDAVNEIMTWMKAQPFFTMPRVPLTTTSLSRDAMAAIERASDVHTTINRTEGLKKWIVKSIPIEKVFCDLYHTSTEIALAYNTLEPRLGDRVVNLCSAGVPFGLKGTVVTIHGATKYVEVIFDEEFIGGKSLQGNCSQFRGRLCRWADLILVPGSAVRLNPTSTTTADAGAQSPVSTAAAGNKLLNILRKPAGATGRGTGETAVADSPQLPPRKPAPGAALVDRGNAQYSDDAEGDAFLDALTDEKQQEMIERMIRQYAAKSTIDGSEVSLAATLGLPELPTLGKYADAEKEKAQQKEKVTSLKNMLKNKNKIITKPDVSSSVTQAQMLKAGLGISNSNTNNNNIENNISNKTDKKPVATTPVEKKDEKKDVGSATNALKNLLIAPSAKATPSTIAPASVATPSTSTAATHATKILKQKLDISVASQPAMDATVAASAAPSTAPVSVSSEKTQEKDVQSAANKLTQLLKAPPATTDVTPAPSAIAITVLETAAVSATVAPTAPAASGESSKRLNSLLRNAKAAMAKKPDASAAPPQPPVLTPPAAPALVTPLPPPPVLAPPAPTLTTPVASVSVNVGKKVDVQALFSVQKKSLPDDTVSQSGVPLVNAEGGKKKLDMKLLHASNTASNATIEEATSDVSSSYGAAASMSGKRVDVKAFFSKKPATETSAELAQPQQTHNKQPYQQRSQQQHHNNNNNYHNKGYKKVEVNALFANKTSGSATETAETTAKDTSGSAAVPAPSKIKVSTAAPTVFMPSRIMLNAKPSTSTTTTTMAEKK